MLRVYAQDSFTDMYYNECRFRNLSYVRGRKLTKKPRRSEHGVHRCRPRATERGNSSSTTRARSLA